MTRPSGVIQSAERALRVLEAVGSAAGGLTAREVAATVGLTLPTTYHLLATLVHAGYVVPGAERRRYVLGFRVHVLHAALRRQVALVPAVGVALRQTHADADAPVYLALFRAREIVIADVADSPRRPRVAQLDVGLHDAPHATAFGKVMLAALDRGARSAEFERRGMPALTPRSVTDRTRLEAQLAYVRRSGVAIEVDEFLPHLACVATPVRNAAGVVVGAVSASVSTAEFGRRRAAVERAVRHGAGRVSRVIGRGPA